MTCIAASFVLAALLAASTVTQSLAQAPPLICSAGELVEAEHE